MSTFKLKIITPERTFFDGEIRKMVLRGIEGEMAILPNHTPLTTMLSIGQLKLFDEGKKYRSATLMDGFAIINPYETVIITDAAEWPDEIDIQRAKAAKERAKQRIKDSNYDSTRAEIALKRAVARIQVAKTLENK